jgi:hypothetical protein
MAAMLAEMLGEGMLVDSWIGHTIVLPMFFQVLIACSAIV